MSAAQHGHGHSPAAWTLAAFVMLGFLVAAIGLIMGYPMMWYVAGALILVGLIAGKVLSSANAARGH